MSSLDSLSPSRCLSIEACLAEAGLATHAGSSSDWVFVSGDTVALTLWHPDMRLGADGLLSVGMNMRAFAGRLQRTQRQDERTIRRRLNAQAVDAALRRASERAVSVAAMIVSGSSRTINDDVDDQSRITHRELDTERWYVDYDDDTGHAVLTRGQPRRRFVDQHSFVAPSAGQHGASQPLASRAQHERREAVRAYVRYRAAGRCEYCDGEGIETPTGIYLETHHVVSLGDGGLEETWNVAALCANDHRRAHHGIDRATIRDSLLLKLSPQRFAAAA